MPTPIIVPSAQVPEGDHLELYLETRNGTVLVWTEGPRGGMKATAIVSLADLKAAVEKLEAPDAS